MLAFNAAHISRRGIVWPAVSIGGSGKRASTLMNGGSGSDVVEGDISIVLFRENRLLFAFGRVFGAKGCANWCFLRANVSAPAAVDGGRGGSIGQKLKGR